MAGVEDAGVGVAACSFGPSAENVLLAKIEPITDGVFDTCGGPHAERRLELGDLVLLSHLFFQIRLVLIFDILVIRFIDHGGEDGRRGAS